MSRRRAENMAVTAAPALYVEHVAGSESRDVVFRRAAYHWLDILIRAGLVEVSDGRAAMAGVGPGRGDGGDPRHGEGHGGGEETV